MKQRADRTSKNHKTSWFYCNRTGNYSTRGEGKCSLRSQGTSKIGCFCPAFITARTYCVTGEVKVEYCLHNVGHRREIAYTQISAKMRSTIAGKLTRNYCVAGMLTAVGAASLTRSFKIKSKALKCMAPQNLHNEISEAVFRRSLQQFLAWLKGMLQPMASYIEEYAS